MIFVHLRNTHGRTAGGRDVQGPLRQGGRGELKTDPAHGDIENVPCWTECQIDSNAPTVPNAMLSFSGQCYQMPPEISPGWRDHLKR